MKNAEQSSARPNQRRESVVDTGSIEGSPSGRVFVPAKETASRLHFDWNGVNGR